MNTQDRSFDPFNPTPIPQPIASWNSVVGEGRRGVSSCSEARRLAVDSWVSCGRPRLASKLGDTYLLRNLLDRIERFAVGSTGRGLNESSNQRFLDQFDETLESAMRATYGHQ